jgi:hypothetical protein
MHAIMAGQGATQLATSGFSWQLVTTHHHQITKLSHSINAIGPAPHRSGRKREHRSIVFATITHIPSLHKIRRKLVTTVVTARLDGLPGLLAGPSIDVTATRRRTFFDSRLLLFFGGLPGGAE